MTAFLVALARVLLESLLDFLFLCAGLGMRALQGGNPFWWVRKPLILRIVLALAVLIVVRQILKVSAG